MGEAIELTQRFAKPSDGGITLESEYALIVARKRG
jgi:hypothetical protein